MPIISHRLRFIEKFLSCFKANFSKIQMEVFREFIYAMFVDCKRMSLASIANNTTINYQKLQYFFSESNWSIKELNDIRIKIIQNQRTTRAYPRGVLAIDDTACPKPYAEKTEGAQFKYFPVDFKSYLPITTPNPKDFKSKLDLAKELINEAVAKAIPFSAVVVDAWYTSTDLIEFVASKNLSL